MTSIFALYKWYKYQIMKKRINNLKKGILMVAMSATVMGFASDFNNTTINKGAKKTAITFVNVKRGNVLKIKDSYGITLYKELIDHSGMYTKGFDLSELPNGDYIFEMNKDVEINTIPFTVFSNDVIFDKEKERKIFKPVTRVQGDLVFVSKLVLDNEFLNIKIYFETVNNGFDLVHSEVVEENKTINRVFKLSQKGSYKIVYHSQGREFIEYINN